jgi:hypothetical protein
MGNGYPKRHPPVWQEVVGMCDPATAMVGVSTALSIGGSFMGYQQQQKAYAANAKAANQATINSYAGIGLRQQQENEKAAQDKWDVGLEMARAKATSTTAAGETGIGGVSFANLLSDYEARGGSAMATTEENRKMTEGALQQEKDSTQAKGQAAINAVPRPSPLGLFADVGAQAAKAGLRIADIREKRRAGTV